MSACITFYLTDNNIDDIILTQDSAGKQLEETKSVVDVATSLVLDCSNSGKYTTERIIFFSINNAFH